MTGISKLFEKQLSHAPVLRKTTAKERRRKIRRIRSFLLNAENEKRLGEALHKDLRKHPTEVFNTEIGPLLITIKHILGHLDDWMRPQKVPAPTNMAGLYSEIIYQPKGIALIMAPWNYPFQLAINPLLYAIAAGNAAIIKPSEISEHTAEFIQKMITELFPEEEVAVVLGGVPVATQLLELPFNHLFFTGSPKVGKIVMEAAAKNLTSVTLELGGKSPAILDGSQKPGKVAAQIAWAKCLNKGQTCIAPDYVLLPEAQLAEFLDGYREAIRKFYNPDGKGIQASPEYGRMVNESNFDRVKGLIEDAVALGAEVRIGGKSDREDRFIEPTVLTGLTEEMAVMREEIFGPVLPVLSFRDLKEVPEILNRQEIPLAFYIHSNKRKNINFLLENSSSGGVVINDLMVTSINPYLPFGGQNHSGIGKSNGFHSFCDFSNERGVVRRKWGTFKFLYPPFSPRLDKLMKFLFKKL